MLSYALQEIEVIKTVTVLLNTANLTLTNPVSFTYTKAQTNVNFSPDFVKVKMASIFDTVNNAIGVYNVSCNFIRDNDILVSIMALPITVSNTICPDITHTYVDNSQFTFVVSLGEIVVNPSISSYINLTLEFIKLKKHK